MKMNKLPNKITGFNRAKFVVIKNAQKGIVLLEALIAILIFSMGILAIVGLQAAMVKNTTDSKYRADASYIAQQQLARMWADPANISTYAATDDIPTLLPNGKRITTYVATEGFVRIVVTWQSPGELEHNYQLNGRITGVSL